ncbi:uncharacterized protein LOC116305644 isoform X2 [Actinia tenebrosa]|uniref:Uncharacterized protein LOC116305644 isoform X2 n=1 Tax=Actinia tenebrosa TaxID=6105 RepID=A0A6P8J0M5_ACTTE|nr:uncharacterized protein LOC116305644 isoform X2 [Actinia tenebrosa]
MIRKGCRKGLQCFIVLLAVCCSLVVFEIHNGEKHFNFKPWKANYTILKNPTYCSNIKTAINFGHWRPKPGLTAEDQEARASHDVFLRRHRGLPDHLFRSDLRCGTLYPIHAPSFGPKLPSMCERNSWNYCCNATNWCSNGTSNCACTGCTDFRKIVSAELHEWTPYENCRVRNYTSEKACSLVNRLSSLVIIGDSLMRHFYAALLMIFTNDPLEGSMRKGLSEKERKRCQGERQFVDQGKSMCNKKLSRSNRDVNAEKFCKGTTNFFFHFNESYSIRRRNDAMKIVRETVNNRSKSFIVVGVGMHDGLNAQKVMNKYVEPILGIVAKRKWPRIVWVTVHAQGYLKPMAYRNAQSIQRIMAYNQQMTKLMEARGVDVLDFFNMTLGVHSYDGTHYGYGVNIAKAQFLLNFIDSTIDSKTIRKI